MKITMTEYAKLSATERKKYKATDIIRDHEVQQEEI